MATIKIYSTSGDGSNMEFSNNGEIDENEMQISIDHTEYDTELLFFHLSKEDAKELVTYLKKEFKI